MILGRTHSKNITVPRRYVNLKCVVPSIDIHVAKDYDLYDCSADFITATVATPHIDHGYTNFLFLTLSLRDGHTFGGEWMYGSGCGNVEFEAERNEWFLIDPACLHWGHPHLFGVDHLRAYRWWGLQWNVPVNSKTESVMREIVETNGGEWFPDEDHFKAVMANKRRQIKRDRK